MKKKVSCLLIFLGMVIIVIVLCVASFLLSDQDEDSNLLNAENSYLPYDEMVLLPEGSLPPREIAFFDYEHSTINFIHPDGSGLETRQIRTTSKVVLTFVSNNSFVDDMTWSLDGRYLAIGFPQGPNVVPQKKM